MRLGPGPSSCSYYGSVDSKCNFKPVAVSDLPHSCTSFFFESVVVDTQYDVNPFSDEHELGNFNSKLRVNPKND